MLPSFRYLMYLSSLTTNQGFESYFILFLWKRDYVSVTAASIRYEIKGGNVGEVFTIDTDTGDVTLGGPLDYESRKQVRLIHIPVGQIMIQLYRMQNFIPINKSMNKRILSQTHV